MELIELCLYIGKAGLTFKHGIDDAKEDNVKYNTTKFSQSFQIILNYENGDDYDYDIRNSIKRISLKDDVFLIDIYAIIHTNDFYEYMEKDNSINDEQYEGVVEMQVRKDDKLKSINMLDCNTGRDYNVNYELLDEYYKKNSQNGSDLCDIEIIDLLGEKYNSTQI